MELKGIRYFIYALFTYGWLSANIPMPVLPSLVGIFNTSETQIKLSVTAFLVSFAFTQIIWGSLSDKYGRKPILILGFCITVLGALLAASARNVEIFILARFIEAIGMGCGPVIARSTITDSFSGKEVTHVIAMSAVIVGVMPSVAPIVGDWLNTLFDWRSIFIFLALYGAVMLFYSISKLRETHQRINRQLAMREVIQSYTACIKHKAYVGGLLLYGIYYGLQLGYYTAAPFLFVVNLHYSTQAYAWLMSFTVASYILGAYLSKQLIKALALNTIIVISIAASAVGLVLLIAFYLFWPLSAWTIILPMGIVIASSGMMSPATNTISMLAFTENRGAASALLGCSMAGFSALFSAAMALFSNRSALPLIGMLTVVVITGISVYAAALAKRDARS